MYATTDGGKRVLLNTSTYTWEYVGGKKPESDCMKNHTGNLTVRNNTKSLIYFYYQGKLGVKYKPVNANTSVTINDLTAIDFNNSTLQIEYHYVAANELQEAKFERIDDITGFEKGTFKLNECDTKTLEIGN